MMVEGFNITSVLALIAGFFTTVFDWLSTHGFVVGGWHISFFDFFIGGVVLYTLIAVILPWFDGMIPDNDDVDYDDFDDDINNYDL